VRSIMLTVIAGALGFAQAPTEQLTFEVASIRPSVATGIIRRVRRSGGPGTRDPERFTCQGCSLSRLLVQAYGIRRYLLSGPSWLNSEEFDVAAVVPKGVTREQFRLMLQNLLAERFKMRSHRDKKEMEVYQLVVRKGGPKFRVSSQDANPQPSSPPGPTSEVDPKFTLAKDGYPELPPGRSNASMAIGRRNRMRMLDASMRELVGMLQEHLDKPLTDATELKAKYDFVLAWSADSSTAMAVGPGDDVSDVDVYDDSGPDLFAALQEQLGLKLEKTKGSVEILVIDHIEKVPSEN
jgi:uncharacterized protein (TIGR03435 family)